MSRRSTRLIVLLTLLVAGPARAVPIEDFIFELEVGGELAFDGLGDLAISDSTNGAGHHTFRLVRQTSGTGFRLTSWGVAFEVDPFLSTSFSLSNTGSSAQSFVLTMGLPIPSFSYEQVVDSFVQVTAFDSNDDFTLSMTSAAFFNGTVDANDTLTLLAPLSLSRADCTNPLGSRCGASAEALVFEQALAKGIATELGMRIAFTLSPGDSANVDARLEILPEPALAWLLAGVVAIFAIRSRADPVTA